MKKKSKLKEAFLWAAALVVVVGLYCAVSPLKGPQHLESVRVIVEKEAPEPLIKPKRLPADEQAIGDEKEQPQMAKALPLSSSHIFQSATGSKPKIAIVIDDMGLDLKDSKRATALPSTITLSYMPYATRLREQTKDARELGHELLLHMPMEPVGHDDPGPGALLVDLPPSELRQRFDTALASFVGFDGVNNHMGSKFTADRPGMEIVIEELKQRNLFFLDSRTNAKTVGEVLAKEQNLPTIARDVFLDDEITIKSVQSQVALTERTARRKGYAVAIGHPHAVTLQVLENWIPEAEKRGFVFVSVRDLLAK